MPAAVSSPKHPKPSPKTFELQARKLLRAASEPCSTFLFLAKPQGSQDPRSHSQGLNLCPCGGVQSLSHWTTREFSHPI